MNLSVEFYTNNDSRITSYKVEKAIQGLIFSRIIFLFIWEWGFDSVYWYARLYGFETSNIAKVVDFTFDSIKKQNKIVHIQHLQYHCQITNYSTTYHTPHPRPVYIHACCNDFEMGGGGGEQV